MVCLDGGDDGELVAWNDDLFHKIPDGLFQFRKYIIYLEYQDEMSVQFGSEFFRCLFLGCFGLLPFDAGSLYQVNGLYPLKNPFLENLEVIHSQIIDEPVSLEHPDRNLDVDGHGFVLMFLGEESEDEGEKS